MGSGESGIGIRMQNAGLGNPPVQDWRETTPSYPGALTATDEDTPPQPAYAAAENAQLRRVPRNGMVLVVAQHSLPEPCTDLGRTMMLPALKLGLDGFELRDHPLLRRNLPDDEGSGGELPAEVGETQERENLRLSILNPFTEQLLRRAGVTTGMRVLDLGCGLGDLAIMAARLVGYHGCVTAIDIDQVALDTARERAGEQGLTNTSFVHSNVDEYRPDHPFDAVIGRHILLHSSNPLSVLRTRGRTSVKEAL
jgi:methyltransferase family protein